MLLIGRFLSPFVRRSATVLNLAGIEFERKEVNTADDADTIKQFNPLGRVPALRDGDHIIVDSHAIVDYALELADSNATLLNKSGTERRETLYLSAIAVGCMEKGVASAYEKVQRPASHFYAPYQNKLRGQVLDGLAHLESKLSNALSKGTWFGGDTPSLADVDAIVAYEFFGIIAPDVMAEANLPNFAALATRSHELSAFNSTRWQA